MSRMFSYVRCMLLIHATYACGEVSVWSMSRMFSYVCCMLLMHVEKYPCGLCLVSVWSMSRMFSYVRCMLLMHVEKYPCGLCLECFHMFAVCYLCMWRSIRVVYV